MCSGVHFSLIKIDWNVAGHVERDSALRMETSKVAEITFAASGTNYLPLMSLTRSSLYIQPPRVARFVQQRQDWVIKDSPCLASVLKAPALSSWARREMRSCTRTVSARRSSGTRRLPMPTFHEAGRHLRLGLDINALHPTTRASASTRTLLHVRNSVRKD
jgi:hypothetical protein